jgi:hypothetical protein
MDQEERVVRKLILPAPRPAPCILPNSHALERYGAATPSEMLHICQKEIKLRCLTLAALAFAAILVITYYPAQHGEI